jgi:hypothetical protein
MLRHTSLYRPVIFFFFLEFRYRGDPLIVTLSTARSLYPVKASVSIFFCYRVRLDLARERPVSWLV